MNSDILFSALIVNHTRHILATSEKMPFADPLRSGKYDLVFECAPHSFILLYSVIAYITIHG